MTFNSSKQLPISHHRRLRSRFVRYSNLSPFLLSDTRYASGTFIRWTRLDGLVRSLSTLPFTSCLHIIVESVRPTEAYPRGSICDPVSRISSLKICLRVLLYSRFGHCSIELLLIESQLTTPSMPSYVFSKQDCKFL
jgi:hypothetical protein